MERRFKLPAGHPIVGQACTRCGRGLAAGDECYMDQEAPATAEDAARMRAGGGYTAQPAPAHWSCHPTQGLTISG